MSEKQKTSANFNVLCGIYELMNANTKGTNDGFRAVNNSISDVKTELKTEIRNVNQRVAKFESEFQGMKNGFQEMKEDIKNTKEKLGSSLSVDAFSREMDAISRKKKNIVIFGLKEGDQATAQERQQHDTNEVTQLFRDLSLEPVVISLPRPDTTPNWRIWSRVGPRLDHKPRPLVIEMESELAKAQIMSSLKRLKGKPKWRGVSISEDRTKLQRENDKKVYEELKAVRDAKNVSMSEEEKNEWEHIIIGRPGDYRVKKVKKRTSRN